MIRECIIDLQFLPSLEYFVALSSFDEVLFDKHEHFIKQSYRNRCFVLGANGKLRLTVPTKKGSQKTPMHSVEIDYSHDWVNPLWRSISSAYGRAPFFEFYSDTIKEILFEKPQLLTSLSGDLLSFCLKCLDMDNRLTFSEEYTKNNQTTITDLRGRIHPKISYLTNPFYRPFVYTQIFGNNFVPNMSIIDLLFCEGPNAREVLSRSKSFT